MFLININDGFGHSFDYPMDVEAETQLTIGRSPDCDIAIPENRHLSRLHCRIVYDGYGLVIEDCGSSNGIYLDGERIERDVMRPGRIYCLGATTITLLGDEDKAEPVPEPIAEEPQPEPEPIPEPVEQEPQPVPEPVPEPVEEERQPEPEPIPEPVEEEPLPEPIEEEPAEDEPAAEEEAPAAPASPPRWVRPKDAKPATLRTGPKGKRREMRRSGNAEAKPRALATAGGGEQSAPPAPRKLSTPSEEAQLKRGKQGTPGSSLGLPVDFPLSLSLCGCCEPLAAETRLRFALRAGADCRIYLVQHDAEGGVALIYPRSAKKEAEWVYEGLSSCSPRSRMRATTSWSSRPSARTASSPSPAARKPTSLPCSTSASPGACGERRAGSKQPSSSARCSACPRTRHGRARCSLATEAEQAENSNS